MSDGELNFQLNFAEQNGLINLIGRFCIAVEIFFSHRLAWRKSKSTRNGKKVTSARNNGRNFSIYHGLEFESYKSSNKFIFPFSIRSFLCTIRLYRPTFYARISFHPATITVRAS